MKKLTFLSRVIVPICFLVLVADIAPLLAEVSSDGPLQENNAVTEESRSELITLKIPLMSPLFSNTPVAVINDEPVRLGDMTRELVFMHSGVVEEGTTKRKAYANLLKRIINSKLIVLEAKNIGFDELSGIRAEMDAFYESTLITTFLRRYVEGLALTADEAEVDKKYRELVKEFNLNTVLFYRAEEAEKAREEIKSGQDFSEISKRYVEEGKAEGGEVGEYFKREQLLPAIADIASEMQTGSISNIFRLGKNFAIVKLEDIRYPEDPEKKEQARRLVLEKMRQKAVEDYAKELKKKYAKVKKYRLKRLDFESEKPGIQKLLKDDRVLVKIEGEEPITVSDLARAMEERFFHGLERAAQGGEVNKVKETMLYDIIYKRVLRKEALNQGIDKSQEFLDTVRRREDAILFGTFIQKVVAPEIRLDEDELRAYYDKNIEEYSYPPMLKIDSLVFQDLDSAKDALDKLRRGTDYKWLRENAGGQIPKEETENLLTFGNNYITVNNLPEDVQDVLSSVEEGDYRVYESPEGHFYVLYVTKLLPSKPMPFEVARKEVAEMIFKEKIDESVEEWAEKLKNAYDTDIFVTEID